MLKIVGMSIKNSNLWDKKKKDSYIFTLIVIILHNIV